MKPVTAQPVDIQAATALRTSILNGDHQPGQPLREVELADTLGTSRATIRVALRDLTNDGLVDTRPNRGSTVRTLTAHDAWEIYTLRNTLEAMAAELLASNITPASSESVTDEFARLERAVAARRVPRILAADLDLHTTIVELTGHQLLADAYQRIRYQTQLYLVHARPHIGGLDNYTSLHEPLVDAITNGDPEAARHLASQHNTIDGEAMARQLGPPEPEA